MTFRLSWAGTSLPGSGSEAGSATAGLWHITEIIYLNSQLMYLNTYWKKKTMQQGFSIVLQKKEHNKEVRVLYPCYVKTKLESHMEKESFHIMKSLYIIIVSGHLGSNK